MTRREFLTAMAALMAATAVEPMSLTTVPMRPIPWAGFTAGRWYAIECLVAKGIVRARIDGQDVSYDARALADLARYMHVDVSQQVIRFGASGLGAQRSGFCWRPVETLPETFSIGFSLNVHEHDGDLAPASLDEMFVTDAARAPDWATDALGYVRTTDTEIQLGRGHESVRIEAHRPART